MDMPVITRSVLNRFRVLAFFGLVALSYICVLRAEDGDLKYQQFDGENDKNYVINGANDAACESKGTCAVDKDGNALTAGVCYNRTGVCKRPLAEGGDVSCPHEKLSKNSSWGLCVEDKVK